MPDRIPYRHLWSLDALSGGELLSLIETASALKRAAKRDRSLSGRHIALLSAGPCDGCFAAFERSATALGATLSFVPSDGMDGAARLLGRLYDAVDCEGLDARTVQRLDRETGVPVYNGLADPNHPTQMLSVLLALRERCGKPLSGLHVAYLGDPGTGVGAAWTQAAMLAGIDLRVAAPPARWPGDERLHRLNATAATTGARLHLTPSADEAADDADAVLVPRDLAPGASVRIEQDCALQAMLLRTLT